MKRIGGVEQGARRLDLSLVYAVWLMLIGVEVEVGVDVEMEMEMSIRCLENEGKWKREWINWFIF